MAIVYTHKRLDNNQVFYIGISKNKRRAFETYANAGNRRNIYWKRIAEKHGIKVEITHENICWEEACKIEQYLIEFWRSQKIQLANLTDGGEGANGLKLSQKQKEKRASYLNNPEVREKQKKAMSRPDVLKKQSEIQKKVYSNLELRKRQSEIQKRIKNTPQALEENRRRALKQMSDLSQRKRISDSLKMYFMNNPNSNTKPIIQYDKDGNFIREWDSIKDAAIFFKKSRAGFINACKNRREYFLNYKWAYKCKKNY